VPELDQRALVRASERCDRLEKSSPPRGIYDVAAALRYPPNLPRGFQIFGFVKLFRAGGFSDLG